MLAKLSKKGLAVSCGIALVFALALTALLCLPLTAAVYREALPLERVGAMAYIAAGISVFAAVFLTARTRARQALPTGAAVAGAYLALMALVCALGGEGASFGAWLWQLGAAVFAGGLLGAVMSIRQKSHRKRRR